MKRFLVPLAVGMLLLAGCSKSSKDESPTSLSRGDGATQSKPGEGAAPAPATEGGATDKDKAKDNTQSKTGAVENRSLIFRADLSVRVDDVAKAAESVSAIATTAGGFISSEKRAIDGRDSHATVTVRVPSKQYAEVLERLAKLGREISRGSNVEDVTEAIVDLDTRIAAQKASVDSVRKMFERAATLQDVVLLEKELNQRQAELASLEAKKRRIDDLVALSTITVSLIGPNTTIVPEEEPAPGFLGGLKSGWKALVATVGVVSAVLGFLLPFAILLGVPLFIILWLLRRRSRKAPSPRAPAADA